MRIVGQERIAEVFGVAAKTIVEWQEQGFPIVRRGSPGVPSEYDTVDCLTWYVQREMDRAQVETAKDRLARLQGDKVERELQVMDKTLIPADEVEPALAQFAADLCAEIEQIPDVFADEIAAVGGDVVAVHHALGGIVRKIKQACAQYEPSPVAAAGGAATNV